MSFFWISFKYQRGSEAFDLNLKSCLNFQASIYKASKLVVWCRFLKSSLDTFRAEIDDD